MDAITVQTVLGRHITSTNYQPCAFTPTQNSLSTQTRMPQRMRELSPFTMSLKSQDTEKIVQSQSNSLLQTVLHKVFSGAHYQTSLNVSLMHS